VHPLTRAVGHPSRTAITDSLMRLPASIGRATLKHSLRHAPRKTHTLV
jgi:hypothetical protein